MATNDIVLVVIIGVFFLGGLISGFVKSTSKIFALAGGGLLSFYLGSVVSTLLIDKIDSVKDFVEANSFGSSLVLVGSYVVVFLIGFIILKIFMKALSNVLNGTGLGKFIDKVLGAVSGIAIGLIVCDIYVWALYGVAQANADVANWIIQDARLNMEGFQTFTKALMEINLNAIGQVFPGL